MSAPLGAWGPSHAEDVAWLRVEGDSDAGMVRRRAVELAEQVGFDQNRVGEVAIVATELATNLVRHAEQGIVSLRLLRRGTVGGVEIVTLDRGPGVRDLSLLFVDGSSSAGTLGIGMGAVRRLSTHHDAHSTPGRGTVVTATFWAERADDDTSVAGLRRALGGESECGDDYGIRETATGRLLMLVDGLGHGPLAARAATAATRTFRESSQESPAALLLELHAAMSGTRGAAVAIARLDLEAHRLTYAGIGNIAGRLLGERRSRHLMTMPGIVGHNARSVRETPYDVTPGTWLVMHSDGLTDRWDTDETPGLLARTPLVVAATLMREAAVNRDDASVLVTRAVR